MNIRRSLVTMTFSLILSGLLYGCGDQPTQPTRTYVGNQPIPNAPVAELGYVNPSKLPAASGKVNNIRSRALQTTAVTLGATGALAWRSEQINASLDKNEDQLNQIFDFNQLLLPHNVVPPVLVEANNSLNLADPNTIRLSSKIYRIVKPARFTTTPPNWREYLWLDFKKPDMPETSFLPRDQDEANIWNCYLQIGWEQGVNQANAIFNANLNRLKRDYNGMVLYRRLLAENIVSAPFVAKAELGVTGNAHEIRINDQVLRITAQSELQPDSSQWQPIITNPANKPIHYGATSIGVEGVSGDSAAGYK